MTNEELELQEEAKSELEQYKLEMEDRYNNLLNEYNNLKNEYTNLNNSIDNKIKTALGDFILTNKPKIEIKNNEEVKEKKIFNF